jgi:UDP-glucose 4-epimerase
MFQLMIAVTGAAGFIGRSLVRKLLDHGERVLALDNLHRGDLRRLDSRVEFRCVDIRNRSALQAALDGAQEIYHLAAQSNVIGAGEDPGYSVSTNVLGTYNVFACARELGVRKVLFTSSREVYGDVSSLPVDETWPLNPKNAYGMSKAAGELYCQEFRRSGLNIITLRLANVYGAGDSGRVIPLFTDRAMSSEDLTIFGQGKILDFVHVDDVVSALISAGEANQLQPVYNIGSGIGTTLEDLALQIIALAGSASSIRHGNSRSIEVDRYVANTERARRELGFHCAVNLTDGLKRVIEYSRGPFAALSVSPYSPVLVEVSESI